jgi:addiction module HigA family antidote
MSPKQRAPITPGEILLTEFLEPKGLSQAKLAALLKIPLQRINLVVKGKRRITAEMALLLAKAFDTSAEFWMNLHNAVDLYAARAEFEKRTA